MRPPNKVMLVAAITAASMGAASPSLNQPKLPGVDIEEEYELIKLKKSKLSANQRQWVIDQWQRRHS